MQTTDGKPARRGVFGRLVDWAIGTFGDLKLFRGTINPLMPWTVIAYDPGGYAVKGADMRAVMATLEPGDLLVRGYHDYLDGKVIPGYFSHVGLYLGPVRPEDRALCTGLGTALVREHARFPGPQRLFATGEQMVVHAIAEGVLIEDVLDFCRCDYMAVLRLPRQLTATGPLPPAPASLTRAETDLRARLAAGPVPFADAFPVLRGVALSRVGYPYDTTFDFTDFTRLSCTEFVYFLTKALYPLLGVAPEEKRVLLLKRRLIEPDAYARSAALSSPWQSESVDRVEWGRLRQAATAPREGAPGPSAAVPEA